MNNGVSKPRFTLWLVTMPSRVAGPGCRSPPTTSTTGTTTEGSPRSNRRLWCCHGCHLAPTKQEEYCFMAVPQACRHACCSHFLSYTIMHVLISSCILGFLSAKPGRSGDVVMMRGSCTMMTSVTSVNYVMGYVLHGSRAVRHPNPNPHYNPNHTLNPNPQTTSMTLTLTLT